jgi:hypothetical protein
MDIGAFPAESNTKAHLERDVIKMDNDYDKKIETSSNRDRTDEIFRHKLAYQILDSLSAEALEALLSKKD